MIYADVYKSWNNKTGGKRAVVYNSSKAMSVNRDQYAYECQRVTISDVNNAAF